MIEGQDEFAGNEMDCTHDGPIINDDCPSLEV